MRLTINDFVDAGICASGVRRWCHENDIDFRAFLKDGVTEEYALSLGPNGHIDRALEKMRERNKA